MTWVKICGTTSLEDAQLALSCGADALGFIFAPSPRQIKPEAARKIVSELPPGVEKVGIFVNESAERTREVVDHVGLTAVQLHGDETEEFARNLVAGRGEGAPKLYRVLTARAVVSLGSETAFLWGSPQAVPYHAVLVDSGSSSRRGGTGVSFDWDDAKPVFEQLRRKCRLILAGGLSPDNVAQAMSVLRPWGVDVVSGVEREPGKKDPEKLKAFLQKVRSLKLETRNY
jgi:phosphoribosylanthranilate isomerase